VTISVGRSFWPNAQIGLGYYGRVSRLGLGLHLLLGLGLVRVTFTLTVIHRSLRHRGGLLIVWPKMPAVRVEMQ